MPARRLGHLLSASALRALERRRVRPRGAVERGDDERRRAGRELEAQRERAEQVLLAVEAALGLARVLVTHPPIAVCDQLACVVMEVERRQIAVGAHGRRPITAFDSTVERVVPERERVVVAKRDERPHLKEAARPGEQRVANDDRIFAVDQEHGLLEAALTDPVGRHRKRIEAKGAEVPVARRVDRTGIEVAPELDGRALGLDHLFESRKQQMAACGRRQRRRQKAVVAPGVCSEDRARGEAAFAVRLEPLQVLRALEVGEDLAIELDPHRALALRRPRPTTSTGGSSA